MNVCSYDIQTERQPWDVFVNTNHPIVSSIFGYNNNVSVGSINTLYYCTLYASKKNQEEETYPYIKVCEAVTTRIKKVSDLCSESGLSSRQIGLRRLLSGINSHLSTCVVIATMAWNSVTHGSRFHYSHEFKPLLLSQLEAWFEGATYSRRIRYKKKQRNKESAQGSTSTRSPIEYGQQSSEVWFDSDISTYLYRPEHPIFNNMSFWEYHSKYDLQTVHPKCYMDEEQSNDDSEKYIKFKRNHPRYLYSCLVRREWECIPKDVDESVNGIREIYAKKVMLMFFPFKRKEDLYGGHDSLWDSFQEEKQKLKYEMTDDTMRSTLYVHSIKSLQNIQDMLNVKKIPSNEDVLLPCTDIHDHDCVNTSDCNRFERDMDIEHSESHINELNKDSSTFDSSLLLQFLAWLIIFSSSFCSPKDVFSSQTYNQTCR
jgi:hypothetical protein